MVAQIVDPVGTFYRFTMASSHLKGRRWTAKGGERRHDATRDGSGGSRIDPVTRLEGHGKIDIFLDDEGEVADCFFQVPELRGFEKFCEGRPVEEMPRITSRICGVCPEAHMMAAAKACDAVYRRQAAR